MILVFAALLPAFLLMRYIYKLDRIEKEPKKLLLKIFLLGAFSVVPTLICEMAFGAVLEIFVEPETLLFILLENFLVVALVEEYWKRWAVKAGAWKNPAFNYRFDAIVYGAFSALGFAALENIFYVMEEGLGLAVLRAITAVPSHAIDGITMGYFLGQAKIAELDGNQKSRKQNMRLALLIPALEHGFYDASISMDSELAVICWLIFVIGIYLYAYRFLKKSSREDQLL